MMHRSHNERGFSVWVGMSGGRGSKPIRTAAEMTVHIKILPVQQPHLYQKLSPKSNSTASIGDDLWANSQKFTHQQENRHKSLQI